MKRVIDVLVANPAGNITIMVESDFDRSEYQKVASQLFAMEELKGEQVAFIKHRGREENGQWIDGKVEMCGLEFCGNASRAFGLLLASENKKDRVAIDMSGCSEVLYIDVIGDHTKVKMPMASFCEPIDLSTLAADEKEAESLGDAVLVHMDGIVHVILKGVAADGELFKKIRDAVEEKYSPAATGVMFVSDDMETMVPVVYVKDVDSTYFEGSCGSGTTACGIAFGQGRADGSYSWNMKQPAGEIAATVCVEGGEVKEVYIEGPVHVGETLQVEIEI